MLESSSEIIGRSGVEFARQMDRYCGLILSSLNVSLRGILRSGWVAKGVKKGIVMGTIATGLLAVFLATVLSLTGMVIARKLTRGSQLDQYHSMTDPTLNVVATLYSILLGFLVAGAMNTYDDTRHMVEMEANDLADVFRLANGLPSAVRNTLQDSCRLYCDNIIQQEWPAMEHKETSKLVWQASQQMWDTSLAFEPQNDRQNNIHQMLLQSVQNMAENRRSRIVVMRSGFHQGLWIVVLGGSILIIGCLYLFFVHATIVQGLMTAMVSLALFLNIFLLFVYNSPFSGDLRIRPDAFELDRFLFAVPESPLSFNSGGKRKASK